MPELPDIVLYLRALEPRVRGRPLEGIRISNPFLLRSVDPPPAALAGRRVTGLRRIGKRIVLELEEELFVVLHLMIAGRLHWKVSGVRLAGKNALAAFDFPNGTLTLTEAGTKRRAALYLVRGEAALRSLDPGGVEVLEAGLSEFRAALLRENHTLKRSLTDPRLFSGIGNAYSDEILHRARLSPFKLTGRLTEEETERLYQATRTVLQEWVELLTAETRDLFPEKVTAFRKEMAVHGRYGLPCPECGAPIQRITYVENECNYCAECQTGGKLLADRGMSRFLKQDWPRTLAELEEMRAGHRG